MSKLKEYRRKTRLKLREVAARVGITPAAVHAAEVNGILTPLEIILLTFILVITLPIWLPVVIIVLGVIVLVPIALIMTPLIILAGKGR